MGAVTHIAVAGNIGTGKSTLVEFLCRTYGAEPFFEPNADNPYLGDFYADMKRWAFHSQVYFLAHKFRIHRELEQKRGGRAIVQDRTIYEDAEVFAAYLRKRDWIDPRDWRVYQDFYRTLLDAVAPPDLMIYLRASLPTVRKRIRLRGRPEERSIPLRYLRDIGALYEEWLGAYRRSPILVLETDRFDYLSDLVHRIDIMKKIEAYLTR